MREKKGISIRVLSEKNTRAKHFFKLPSGSLREHRFIPEKFVFSGNIHIYGNYVMIFTNGKDEEMAVSEMEIFVSINNVYQITASHLNGIVPSGLE